MNQIFGPARAVVHPRYAVLPPAGFVPSRLPGWEQARCQVMVSPALGARFFQMRISVPSEGLCEGNTGPNEYFIYLVEGSASLHLQERRHRLETGSYVYVPPGLDLQLQGAGPASTVLVFQKPYLALSGVAKPAARVGHEREAKAAPWPETESVRCQSLLADQPAFDLAVQILTFSPGAAWPVVYSGPMEQSLTLLKGQGMFKLNENWHPSQAGDVIWVAPYCPHWFAAIGKEPACLIRCLEVNREPV